MTNAEIIDTWIVNERQDLLDEVEHLEEQIKITEKVIHALEVIESYRKDKAEAETAKKRKEGLCRDE